MGDTNPFKQIHDAIQGDDYLGSLGIASGNIHQYNGEAEKDWELVKSMVAAATGGPIAFTRIFRADPDSQGAGDLISHDCGDTYVQIIIATAALQGRGTAGAWVEQLAWDAYAAIKQSKTGLDWLGSNWLWAGFANEHQAHNCAIWSVLFRAHVDFAKWTE